MTVEIVPWLESSQGSLGVEPVLGFLIGVHGGDVEQSRFLHTYSTVMNSFTYISDNSKQSL